MNKKKQMESSLIHEGYDPLTAEGSLTPPIYQTSTFVFPNAEAGEARFSGDMDGYIYTRLGNPTLSVLERRMAEIEGAEAAVAFSSGMAAISAVLIKLVKSGDHIVCSKGLYGCSYDLLTLLNEKFKVAFTLVDMSDPEKLRQAIRPETKVIFVETPINPTMKLVDLRAVSAIAKQRRITTVVDNTFATPYLQRPLELGCDVVLHSATKYISGHGDVIAGIACGSQAFMDEVRAYTLKNFGGVLSPFDAWLLIRGLKTLSARMERHTQSAMEIATFLEQQEEVARVYYPGLNSFEQHDLGKVQMDAAGGMVSFEINGGKKEAQAFLNQLRMIKIAVSLGDAETLIEHPATMTHAVVPEEDKVEMGITDSLIRLSVGLEHVDELKEDLMQALKDV